MITKINEFRLNISENKIYNTATDARNLYYISKEYNINLDKFIPMINDELLKKYLIHLKDINLNEYKKGDKVIVLDGVHKGKSGVVDHYEYIDNYLRRTKEKTEPINIYIEYLNAGEASSIHTAKNWAEVPSSTAIPITYLKKA